MSAAIQTRHLTKFYGRVRGVEDIDLEVPTGEVFGFLGPNGAGKSTTIRTLLDFQRPTSGAADVLGLDSVRDSVAIRRRVGYVPGELHLFDGMTGQQHLDWFDRVRGPHDADVATSLIDRFGITLDRRVEELSKGNRQKVGLLLAFAHRPELLVLDEPTSGLDPLVQAEFEHLLRETAAEGRTVLLSSHSLDEVQRVADRVAIIRDGRLVVSDTVERLRADAPRVMSLRFASTVDPSVFARLEGVNDVSSNGEGIDLTLTGEVAPVLEAAVAHGVVDITARHADLDELFLSYYRDTPQEQR